MLAVFDREATLSGRVPDQASGTDSVETGHQGETRRRDSVGKT